MSSFSVVTLAELRFGIELAPDIMRRADLNDWLTHKVRPMFEGRVLPISEDVMFKWRLLVEDGRKTGHTFSQLISSSPRPACIMV
jgi:predicted nucleic acid-binding protein